MLQLYWTRNSGHSSNDHKIGLLNFTVLKLPHRDKFYYFFFRRIFAQEADLIKGIEYKKNENED